MPNGPVHKMAGALTGVSVALLDNKSSDENTDSNILANAAIGYCLGSLPDILEPATNPNHRQFFHSFLVLGAVALGTKKAYDWCPESSYEQWIRKACLLVGSVYAVHLILDAGTPKSLPLVGRL